MASNSGNELRDFHRFVGEKVDAGGSRTSPEEALDECRILHPDPSAAEDDLDAIQEALDDADRGDVGVPFQEFDRSFRAARDLPRESCVPQGRSSQPYE